MNENQPMTERMEGTENSHQEQNSSGKHNVYIIGGEKGGVGKSFFSRILLEYFIRRGWGNDFILIDADPTIDDVASVFGERCKKIIFSDSKYEQTQPIEIFKEVQSKTVVVNLPSNVSRQFDQWFLLSGVLEEGVRQLYQKIYYFFISDGCFRSVDRLLKQLETYGTKTMPHILVLNPGRLTCSGTFHYLESYLSLIEGLKKYKIPVLLCPELPTDLQFFCDQECLTYEAAKDKQDFPVHQQRIVSFLRRVDLFFSQLFEEGKPDIDGMSRLSKLIKEQKKKLDENQLPLPSKAEMLQSLSA